MQESIYKHYFPYCNLNGVKVKSPFRVDNKPSFTIKKYNNWYLWKDWATGEKGNCFDFVAKYYGLNTKLDFNNILNTIIKDLQYEHLYDLNHTTLNKLVDLNKIVKNNINELYNIKTDEKVVLKYYKKAFNTDEINYWKSQGILSKNTLDYFDVSSVSKAFMVINNYIKSIYDYSLYKDFKDFEAKKFFYCFAYNYDNTYLKLYRPFHFDKWKSTVPHNMVCTKTMFGNDTLVITKAKKEQMHFHELNKLIIDKFDVLPLNNETTFVDWYYYQLRDKYKKIIVWLDSDKAGIKQMKLLNQKYNLNYCYITEGKNITDVYSNNFLKYSLTENIKNSLCLTQRTLSN